MGVMVYHNILRFIGHFKFRQSANFTSSEENERKGKEMYLNIELLFMVFKVQNNIGNYTNRSDKNTFILGKNRLKK